MSQTDLPFESAFRDWMRRREMSWESFRHPLPPAGDDTTAHRLSPAGRPQRIVVALHGAGNDALFGWVGLFKRLLLERSEIVTFDLPGHGRLNRSSFTADAAVDCVASVLADCSADSRRLPVHAVGVSLGGSVLLGALSRSGAALTRAAAIVAPLRIVLSWRTVLGEVGPRSLSTVWREREHYGWTGLIPSFGSFKREIYPLRLPGPASSSAVGYVGSLNSSLDAMRLEHRAASVTTPLLLVYGSHDRVVPIEQGERLVRVLPDARLLRIEGGTHLSTPLDSETVDRVVAWLT
ncbi:MAG: alpha/beta fold hydrolase, partial [Gemmatimonadota bacterium]